MIFKTLFLLTVTVCALLLWSASVLAQSSIAQERSALVAFYNATGGPNWKNNRNWLSQRPIREWYGVQTVFGTVFGLRLPGNGLRGHIPPEVANLSELDSIDLSQNHLSGVIPNALEELPLVYLDLSANELTGTIPHGLGTRRLAELDLSSNQLRGSIPPELGNLRNLTELILDDNHLTGEIPSALGNLDNLEYLNLSENKLSGTIPSDLGRLPNLRSLDLSANQLTGKIPSDLSRLSALRTLSLEDNRLTGEIPHALSSLSWTLLFSPPFGNPGLCLPESLTKARAWAISMKEWGFPICGSDRAALFELYYSTNGASWNNNNNWLSEHPMGTWHGVYTDRNGRVVAIDLRTNRLRGVLPEDLGDLRNLRYLYLYNNSLSGALPPSLGNLVGLERLIIHTNKLSGTIPKELSRLSKLSWLVLHSNQLSGNVPEEFKDLALTHFVTSKNGGLCLPASLLAWYNNISVKDKEKLPVCNDNRQRDRASLIALYESASGDDWTQNSNWLSDRPLGDWYGVMTDEAGVVIGLDLIHNGLSGTLPPQLGNLPGLRDLRLSNNQLIGSIPAELGKLSKLSSLVLHSNRLTGSIPPELGNLTELSSLQLGRNQLSGSIPRELARLSNLLELGLDENKLRGAIPRELEQLSGLAHFRTAGTELCLPVALSNWHSGIVYVDTLSNCENTPVFDAVTVADQSFRRRTAIMDLVLPEASGGDGVLTYSLTPALPPGLHFDAVTRVVSGTPTTVQSATAYTYTASDSDGDTARTTFTITVSVDPSEEYDRDALVAFYEATEGANWKNDKNWLSDHPIEEWHGVTTDGTGRVTELSLSGNGLTGTLPSDLGKLSKLTHLGLASNRLAGPIPSELALLSNLSDLILYDNRLTGPIPVEFFNLSGLQYFVTFETELCLPEVLESWHADILFRDILPSCVQTPAFNGRTIANQVYTRNTPIRVLTLPAATGGDGVLTYVITPTLPQGLVFNASTRTLSGTPTVAQSPAVHVYAARDASGNTAQLTFTIGVREVGTPVSDRDVLSALYDATGGAKWKNNRGWLGNGPLSSWYGVTTDPSGRVTRLALSNNGLTGSLPPELGSLSNLDTLFLYNNRGLMGPLPTTMGGLSSLRSLYTFGTALCLPLSLATWHEAISTTSPIETCTGASSPDRNALLALYNSTRGAYWRNARNWLSDRPIGEWHGVTTDVAGRVVKILLASNNLSGTLPSALSKLAELKTIWLSDNQLSGSIPPELGDLTKLETLVLEDNDLSGSIPPDLGALRNLRYLFLSGNHLTGSIPPQLGNLPRLVHLSLYDNALTGSIPSALGKLPRLETLDLNDNRLARRVPAELGSLSRLKMLDIGGYDGGNSGLAGPLPPELGKLTRLGRLVTSGTEICLPSALAKWFAGIGQANEISFCDQIAGSDREALIALYNATDGANWSTRTNWLSDKPLDSWHGVVVGGAGRVTRLNLADNGLVGSLPAELASLTKLNALYLYNNTGLAGGIPATMGRLSGLQTLYTFGTGLCLPLRLSSWHAAIGTRNRISACVSGEEIAEALKAAETAVNETHEALVRAEAAQAATAAALAATEAARADAERAAADHLVEQAAAAATASTQFATEASDAAEIAAAAADGAAEASDRTLKAASKYAELAAEEAMDAKTAAEAAETAQALTDTAAAIAAEAQEMAALSAEMAAAAAAAAEKAAAHAPTTLAALLAVTEDALVNAQLAQAVAEAAQALAEDALAETEQALAETEAAATANVPTNASQAAGRAATAASIAAEAAKDAYDAANSASQSQGEADQAVYQATALQSPSNSDMIAQIVAAAEAVADANASAVVALVRADDAVDAAASAAAKAWQIADSLSGSVPVSDRAALVALYNATGGANWNDNTNWLSDGPIGEWYGVTTNGIGRVSRLELKYNGLAGSIPSELGQLTSLRYLSLRGNELIGSIPSEIGNLSVLESIDFHENQLSGSIPSELGGLLKLTYAALSYNGLSGSIPQTFGNLANLSYLYLQGNPLTGKVPAQLGRLSNLKTLSLGPGLCLPSALVPWHEGIQQKGNIPVCGILDELIEARDAVLAALTDAEANAARAQAAQADAEQAFNETEVALIATLDALDSNDATAATAFAALATAHAAAAEQAAADAAAADSAAAEAAERSKAAHDSAISAGPVGSERDADLLAEIVFATDAAHNAAEVAVEAAANAYDAAHGAATAAAHARERAGELDHIAGAATDRAALVALYNATGGANWNNNTNWLSDGPIGEWYGVTTNGIGRVSHLELSYNGLTGWIPSELGQLSSLRYLSLRGNGLTSSIPSEIGNLSALESIDFHENQLSGSIPPELGTLLRLNYIALSYNDMSSSIPPELGNLSNLIHLYIQGNRLTGQVPAQLGGLSNLRTLSLALNQLTGSLPLELSGLSSLNWITVSGNPSGLCLPAGLSAWYSNVPKRDALVACTDAASLGLPALLVADARASEGTNDTIDFRVMLSRAATTTVTVDYVTTAGTATAGTDYNTASGTLVFAPPETQKTIGVPIFDDTIDEGLESFTLELSNASGALISDSTATGTITNSDPLQTMWLARFSRTVADQITEAVAGRTFGASPGSHITLGGHRVNLAREVGRQGEGLDYEDGPNAETDMDLKTLSGWLRDSDKDGKGQRSQGMTGREVLLGTSFHLAGVGDGNGPGLATWGRVSASGFSGNDEAEQSSVQIDGDAVTGIVGVDAEWDRLLAGLAVSVSEADGTFRQSDANHGKLSSTLTGVYPYARFAVTDRILSYALFGYAAGEMTISQEANENRSEIDAHTDIAMYLLAGGARGALLQADEALGFDLAARADGFVVRSESEKATNTVASEAVASRFRLALEGKRVFEIGGGSMITPGLELGTRYDGGDAENGMGLELGGSVLYSHPGLGLSIEARARTLVAHEDAAYEEWGASTSVRLEPRASGRGLSFSLVPVWGVASGSTETVWAAHDVGALAIDRTFEATKRLDVSVGYGLDGPRGIGLLTPNVGLTLSDNSAQTFQTGVSWLLGSGASLALDGTHIAPVNDNRPELTAALRLQLRW